MASIKGARHAVAALLNASNPDVSYAYTVDKIIEWTQDAIEKGSYRPAKDLFVEANEAGRPINFPLNRFQAD